MTKQSTPQKQLLIVLGIIIISLVFMNLTGANSNRKLNKIIKKYDDVNKIVIEKPPKKTTVDNEAIVKHLKDFCMPDMDISQYKKGIEDKMDGLAFRMHFYIGDKKLMTENFYRMKEPFLVGNSYKSEADTLMSTYIGGKPYTIKIGDKYLKLPKQDYQIAKYLEKYVAK